jgi:hypothetical protein
MTPPRCGSIMSSFRISKMPLSIWSEGRYCVNEGDKWSDVRSTAGLNARITED